MAIETATCVEAAGMEQAQVADFKAAVMHIILVVLYSNQLYTEILKVIHLIR